MSRAARLFAAAQPQNTFEHAVTDDLDGRIAAQ